MLLWVLCPEKADKAIGEAPSKTKCIGLTYCNYLVNDPSDTKLHFFR